MRKIVIFLLTIILCSFSATPAIAKNADVSGSLSIKMFIPGMTIHTVYDYYIFSTGTWQTIETDQVNGAQVLEEGFGSIIQNPDGSFSGNIGGPCGHVFIADSATITGKVSGNAVTFQVSGSYYRFEDEIPGLITGTYTYKSLNTCNFTESFSGAISGNSITGSLSGSGSIGDSLTYIPPDGNNYNSCSYVGNHTTSYAGTFIVTGLSTDNSLLPPPPDSSKDSQFGEPSDPNKIVGDPINSVTGNMHIITSDLTIPAPGIDFSFTRTYNNQAGQANGSLGFGWTHSYNIYLKEDTAANTVKIKDEEAKGCVFSLNTDGAYIPQRGEYSTLTKNSSGFVWTKKDGKAYIFDLSGRLNQIKDRNNNTVGLSYNSQNRLTVITDTCGRQTNLSYNVDGRISTLTDIAGKTWAYNYDSQGNLVTFIDPLGHATTYKYDSNHNITKKIDALGKAVYFAYDDQSRCISSTGEDNIGFTSLNFDPDNKKPLSLIPKVM